MTVLYQKYFIMKMNRSLFTCLLLVAPSFCIKTVLAAESPWDNPPTYTTDDLKHYWANLAKEPWTQQETDYVSFRHMIDQKYWSNQLTQAELNRYQKAAYVHPSLPLALYRWGYYGYLYKAQREKERQNLLWQSPKRRGAFPAFPELPYYLWKALFRSGSAHNYEYARLCLLIGADDSSNKIYLLPLARRLLHTQPKDFDVEYLASYLMAFTYKSGDLEKAISLTKRLYHEYPKQPYVLSHLGDEYRECFIRTRKMKFAYLALATYRKYLQAFPPTRRKDSIANLSIQSTQRLIRLVKAGKSPYSTED